MTDSSTVEAGCQRLTGQARLPITDQHSRDLVARNDQRSYQDPWHCRPGDTPLGVTDRAIKLKQAIARTYGIIGLYGSRQVELRRGDGQAPWKAVRPVPLRALRSPRGHVVFGFLGGLVRPPIPPITRTYSQLVAGWGSSRQTR